MTTLLPAQPVAWNDAERRAALRRLVLRELPDSFQRIAHFRYGDGDFSETFALWSPNVVVIFRDSALSDELNDAIYERAADAYGHDVVYEYQDPTRAVNRNGFQLMQRLVASRVSADGLAYQGAMAPHVDAVVVAESLRSAGLPVEAVDLENGIVSTPASPRMSPRLVS